MEHSTFSMSHLNPQKPLESRFKQNNEITTKRKQRNKFLSNSNRKTNTSSKTLIHCKTAISQLRLPTSPHSKGNITKEIPSIPLINKYQKSIESYIKNHRTITLTGTKRFFNKNSEYYLKNGFYDKANSHQTHQQYLNVRCSDIKENTKCQIKHHPSIKSEKLTTKFPEFSLTPIPMTNKKELKYNNYENKQLSKAERTAVHIRRLEYSSEITRKRKIPKFDTVKMKKLLKIQVWWRTMVKIIRIQKAYRGYLFRKGLIEILEEKEILIDKLLFIDAIFRKMFIKKFLPKIKIFLNSKKVKQLILAFNNKYKKSKIDIWRNVIKGIKNKEIKENKIKRFNLLINRKIKRIIFIKIKKLKRVDLVRQANKIKVMRKKKPIKARKFLFYWRDYTFIKKIIQLLLVLLTSKKNKKKDTKGCSLKEGEINDNIYKHPIFIKKLPFVKSINELKEFSQNDPSLLDTKSISEIEVINKTYNDNEEYRDIEIKGFTTSIDKPICLLNQFNDIQNHNTTQEEEKSNNSLELRLTKEIISPERDSFMIQEEERNSQRESKNQKKLIHIQNSNEILLPLNKIDRNCEEIEKINYFRKDPLTHHNQIIGQYVYSKEEDRTQKNVKMPIQDESYSKEESKPIQIISEHPIIFKEFANNSFNNDELATLNKAIENQLQQLYIKGDKVIEEVNSEESGDEDTLPKKELILPNDNIKQISLSQHEENDGYDFPFSKDTIITQTIFLTPRIDENYSEKALNLQNSQRLNRTNINNFSFLLSKIYNPNYIRTFRWWKAIRDKDIILRKIIIKKKRESPLFKEYFDKWKYISIGIQPPKDTKSLSQLVYYLIQYRKRNKHKNPIALYYELLSPRVKAKYEKERNNLLYSILLKQRKKKALLKWKAYQNNKKLKEKNPQLNWQNLQFDIPKERNYYPTKQKVGEYNQVSDKSIYSSIFLETPPFENNFQNMNLEYNNNSLDGNIRYDEDNLNINEYNSFEPGIYNNINSTILMQNIIDINHFNKAKDSNPIKEKVLIISSNLKEKYINNQLCLSKKNLNEEPKPLNNEKLYYKPNSSKIPKLRHSKSNSMVIPIKSKDLYKEKKVDLIGSKETNDYKLMQPIVNSLQELNENAFLTRQKSRNILNSNLAIGQDKVDNYCNLTNKSSEVKENTNSLFYQMSIPKTSSFHEAQAKAPIIYSKVNNNIKYEKKPILHIRKNSTLENRNEIFESDISSQSGNLSRTMISNISISATDNKTKGKKNLIFEEDLPILLVDNNNIFNSNRDIKEKTIAQHIITKNQK